jgi:hypothetical protein
MIANCTICRLPEGDWLIQHASTELGSLALRGASREEVLSRMQAELQYRAELCPCSGGALGPLEVVVHELTSPANSE